MPPPIRAKLMSLVADVRGDIGQRRTELELEQRALAADTQLHDLLKDTWIALHVSLLLGDTTPRWGLVIGADQTLDLSGELVGKAADLGAARERLISLRGRRHQLHSATAAAQDGELLWTDVRTATSLPGSTCPSPPIAAGKGTAPTCRITSGSHSARAR